MTSLQWDIEPTTTVLVVDDERPLVRLVRSYLERERFRVVEAFHGRQAVDAARVEAPDVVVLDLMLSGVDGLEVAREAPRLQRRLHHHADGRGRTSIGRGSVGRCRRLRVKPVSPRELVARIHAMLRRATWWTRSRGRPRFGDLVIDVDAR